MTRMLVDKIKIEGEIKKGKDLGNGLGIVSAVRGKRIEVVNYMEIGGEVSYFREFYSVEGGDTLELQNWKPIIQREYLRAVGGRE